LKTIARSHFPSEREQTDVLFEAVAGKVIEMRSTADADQAPPSTAEYLDAVRACLTLGVAPGDSKLWQAISAAVLVKSAQTSAVE
jgi:hypothetical protein